MNSTLEGETEPVPLMLTVVFVALSLKTTASFAMNVVGAPKSPIPSPHWPCLQ